VPWIYLKFWKPSGGACFRVCIVWACPCAAPFEWRLSIKHHLDGVATVEFWSTSSALTPLQQPTTVSIASEVSQESRCNLCFRENARRSPQSPQRPGPLHQMPRVHPMQKSRPRTLWQQQRALLPAQLLLGGPLLSEAGLHPRAAPSEPLAGAAELSASPSLFGWK